MDVECLAFVLKAVVEHHFLNELEGVHDAVLGEFKLIMSTQSLFVAENFM